MLFFSFENLEYFIIKDILLMMQIDRWIGDFTKESLPKNIDKKLENFLTKNKIRNHHTIVIKFNRKIIGLAFFASCNTYKDYAAKLPENNYYWKIITLFIIPQYRNKGVATKCLIWFISQKKRVIYFVDRMNNASIKAVSNAGLKYSHDFAVDTLGQIVLIKNDEVVNDKELYYYRCYKTNI